MINGVNISNEALNNILEDKYGIKPPPMQLWRAKPKAKKYVKESHKEFFKRLPQYMQLLNKYNLRSDVFLGFDLNYNSKMHSSRKFKRVYIYLKPIKKGFINGYRLFYWSTWLSSQRLI